MHLRKTLTFAEHCWGVHSRVDVHVGGCDQIWTQSRIGGTVLYANHQPHSRLELKNPVIWVPIALVIYTSSKQVFDKRRFHQDKFVYCSQNLYCSMCINLTCCACLPLRITALREQLIIHQHQSAESKFSRHECRQHVPISWTSGVLVCCANMLLSCPSIKVGLVIEDTRMLVLVAMTAVSSLALVLKVGTPPLTWFQ